MACVQPKMVMFVSSHWSARCCPLHWNMGNSPHRHLVVVSMNSPYTSTLESNVHNMPQNRCTSTWWPNELDCIANYQVIMGQFIGIHQIININWCFAARYSDPDVGRTYSSCIIQCAANKYKQNITTTELYGEGEGLWWVNSTVIFTIDISFNAHRCLAKQANMWWVKLLP